MNIFKSKIPYYLFLYVHARRLRRLILQKKKGNRIMKHEIALISSENSMQLPRYHMISLLNIDGSGPYSSPPANAHTICLGVCPILAVKSLFHRPLCNVRGPPYIPLSQSPTTDINTPPLHIWAPACFQLNVASDTE